MLSKHLTNWERILMQISENLSYKNDTENMFSEVIKWTSHDFLGSSTSF
jgi:hypothetical protein